MLPCWQGIGRVMIPFFASIAGSRRRSHFSDFDETAIRAAGYDLVRRPTGGRAILHADELTYAVIGSSPGPVFGATLHETYMKINRALLAFLADLGVVADISTGESREEARGLVCFRSAGRHEVSVAGRKIIGSAQRRTGGNFLQHGSILGRGEGKRRSWPR